MNRSLKLSVLLALAVGSGQAAALELGQIQVKSALGQPLVAEIPLSPEHPSEVRDLTAKLASSEDFSRAGITGGAPSIPLQFSVVDGANGKKVIRITSSAPVNDPYLDLLIEVSSSAGKSVREFAILLDPPNAPAAAPVTRAPAEAPASASSSGKPSRHAAPAPSGEAAAPKPAKPARQAAPASAPAEARKPAGSGGEYGPVESGQTLSGVAKATAPNGVDINQMLLALKQANPDAFYRDNINALKTGAVLRIPSREDAQAMAVAAAVAEVRRQNSDWRSGAARTPTSVADAGTRASASTAPAAKGESGDRLALVPAKEGGQGGESRAAGNGKEGKGAANLHQDLLRSQEAMATLEQQGQELKSRLKDLEDINAKNAHLLSLKDNEIAELQRKLSEARKTAGLPAGTAAAAGAAAAAKPAEPAAANGAKPAPAASAAKPSPAPEASPTLAVTPAGASSAPRASAAPSQPVASTPAPAPAKPAAKPPVAAPAPEPEPEAWYTQTWALAAAGGAAVLLALVALLSRRRKAAPEPSAPSSSLADRFGTEPEIGNIDPDQDELLDQLAEHPDDVGLHLELVSLYYSRRDVEHFEAAAEAMHAHITSTDQPEWVDVVHMGEDLAPGHPLFSLRAVAPPLPPQNVDEHEALDQFDLGRYAGHEDDTIPSIPAAPVPAKHSKVSEYHFDFDLTPRPLNAAAPAAAPHAEEAQREPASSWQFADLEEEANEAVVDSEHHGAAAEHMHEAGQFSDDPVDTKLDLARAYLDMGDPDGARAMLEEVLHEGAQMQKEVARKLLDGIR
jgi:pilus assembly protein FimV